ncbi:MAG: MerR family DNA-binding transcriptional regulator [Caldimonas sp.]
MPSSRAARASAPAAAPAAPAAQFTIGELAREFGLTTRAIRFYEDCGLLTPERAGRNRVYTVRDRARLTLTLRGKRLGLKLAEVRELIDMYDTRRDTEPQLRRFLDVLQRHRTQLEERLGDLRSTLDEVLAQQAAARRLLRSRAAKP